MSSDIEVPNAARVYDYFLGGAHNFAPDRTLAARITEELPQAVELARANRRFLVRAVQDAVEQGITQFLDLGSGIPTVGNVHEVPRARRPETRVVYVDHEPVAAAHAREILADVDGADILERDLRDVDAVLGAAGELLDLRRPVALLTVAVLHFLPDADEPGEVLARYRRALAPGSIVVFSHVSDDYDDEDLVAASRAASRRYASSSDPTTQRSRAEMLALLGDVPLTPPGLEDVARWAAPDVPPLGGYGAVTAPLP